MTKISYSGYRFPTEIVQQAIWLYVRFTLSFRDVEDLLAERGIVVSYETVRRWVNHFGPRIAANLRKRRSKPQPIKLDQFAPRVALGEASAHDASLSRGRLNTGKFAALKLFCALSMERVPKDVRPTSYKIPFDPRKPYAETGLEPWFYKTFWHHDARPAGMR